MQRVDRRAGFAGRATPDRSPGVAAAVASMQVAAQNAAVSGWMFGAGLGSSRSLMRELQLGVTETFPMQDGQQASGSMRERQSAVANLHRRVRRAWAVGPPQ